MSALGKVEFADAVIADLWPMRVPLGVIAREAGVTMQDMLERVSVLALPPRRPPGVGAVQHGTAL